MFGTASVREPSQRKSSTSSLHGAGRGEGGDTRFWSGGTGGVVRLPDPPALCAVRLRMRPVLSRAGRRQKQMASEDAIVKGKKYQNLFVVVMDFRFSFLQDPLFLPKRQFNI